MMTELDRIFSFWISIRKNTAQKPYMVFVTFAEKIVDFSSWRTLVKQADLSCELSTGMISQGFMIVTLKDRMWKTYHV